MNTRNYADTLVFTRDSGGVLVNTRKTSIMSHNSRFHIHILGQIPERYALFQALTQVKYQKNQYYVRSPKYPLPHPAVIENHS